MPTFAAKVAAMEAIVVGAGIGGLATALALGRVGVRTTVLERGSELRLEGAGISLWSNAVRALQELRVDTEVLAAGSELRQAETLNQNGRLLSRSSLVEAGGGAPSICVARGDLLNILAAALEDQQIRFQSRVVSFQQSSDAVSVELDNGESLEADILIGADGIHSKLRAQLFGEEPPRSANTACWRGMVEWASPYLQDGNTQVFLGNRGQLGVLPCGDGKVYWFAARATDAPLAEEEHAPPVLEFFGDWAPPVVELLKATPPEAILFNQIVDRPPVGKWGEGRVVLLGDAAHSTTPNLGQGGCQALESAVVLAHCLRVSDDPEQALSAYTERRRPRTSWVTQQSRLAGSFLQMGPLLGRFRDRYLASSLGRWSAATMMERLLGERVTPLP